jgi:hypothetical protein
LESSPWKEHQNGYSYAKWDRLIEKEPATIALLKQEVGTRAETQDFVYYVNYHPVYGWSVGRKRKNNPEEQQPRTSSPYMQMELQELRQLYISMTSTIEKKFAELSETLNRLEENLTNTITTSRLGEKANVGDAS